MSTKMSIEEMEEEMASLEEKLGAEDSYASDGDDAEFEVQEDATKAQIKRAFVKSLKTKKLNKKVLGEFISLVA